MPKIAYTIKEKGFQAKSLALIETANEIIDEYRQQGYDLTLRQLYYQMVARDIIANNAKSYDNLGALINEGRMTGYIDWNAIVDRTRNLRKNSHWNNAKSIIQSAAYSFAQDKWRLQKYRPEVWVEKDALVGVVGQICNRMDVPFFACRGYTSQSEMWSAANRILGYVREGFQPIIFHLGDHDPSGIDMSRDIKDRLSLFVKHHIVSEGLRRPKWYHGGVPFRRLALNWNQIEQYNPPPNPAKLTDSRANEYVENYGYESWELDALSPTQISDLIENALLGIRDEDSWRIAVRLEEDIKDGLNKAAKQWKSVIGFLSEKSSPTSEEGVEEEDGYEEEE